MTETDGHNHGKNPKLTTLYNKLQEKIKTEQQEIYRKLLCDPK